ncbi:hypothetical protein L207DRAFT_524245 [Hyaloscypha variabilis F]|uniref:Cytochrome b561 domain-containing protein n=1 Tax=Hyaloscypha variabilis (strain UAMH 11265 / GT02V1 / F) TaxID=1149755 RepID=A0A2J6S807_HYAVF|nr:hypothetical protein L207DRAFT_524245 [Hyaloscypha variabilis F]
MGSLNENARLGRIARGIVYPMVILLVMLFTFEIFTSFKKHASSALDLPRKRTQHEVAPKARVYATSERLRNEEAQELLLESLTLMRDLMVDIRSGNNPKISSRDLASAFSGIFSDIGDSLASGASGASMYLGVGIGNGTLTGLALPAKMMKENTAIAPATGINSIAEGLGMGLTSSIVGSINVSSLLGGATDPSTVNAAVLSLAQGLGGGAAQGLNLKSVGNGTFNTSGLNGIAGNLGQGLSTSFLGGVNLSKVVSMVGGNMTGAQTNDAVLALAQGLGSGAVSALQLSSKPADNSSFNTTGLNGIAGNFGQGLSTSALSNLSLTRLTAMMGNSSLTSTFSNINLTSAFSDTNLLAAANGLGTGLAEGAVVGLGFQQDSAVPDSANGTASIGPIVQTFAKGLSESFLANGTLSKAVSSLTSSTSRNSTSGGLGGLSLSSLPIGKVAEGFAIGLVDGAQSSIENAGGIGGVFNMSPSDTVGMMAMPTVSNFDDGVGGAATGFGTGLGSELTKGLLQAFGKPPLDGDSTTAASPETTSTEASNSTALAAERSISGPVIGKRSLTVAGVKRQSQTPMTTSKLDLMMLNTTLDPILQGGIDALGCQGVGGVVAIGLSLLQSGKISLGSFGNLTSSFSSLTNQTYTIKEGGNTYTANLANKDIIQGITLNGQPVVKAVVLIVLHVILAINTYIFALPAIILLNTARNFAVMSGRVQFLAKAPRWQFLIGMILIVPGSLLTLIFGVVGEGKRSHFVSAHGVMGLILVLLTLAAAGLAPIRYRTPAINLAHKLNLLLVMLLSVAVVITAFLDISSISICATQFLPQAIFVFIGFLLAIPYLTVLGAVAMEMGLKRWFVGREVAGARDGVGNEKGVGKEVEVEMGYKVGDVKVGQIEGVASIIGGTHNSISKPISGGRLS